MAKAPDRHETREFPLSRRAREIKKQLDEGRYPIDLGALADALVDAGVLDEETGADDDSDAVPGRSATGLARNGQNSGDA